MEVIPLPGAGMGDRSAVKRSLVVVSPSARPPRLAVMPEARPQAYCARCAGVIEFGAVTRGRDAYCSVECSLEGDRPG
jgi:hypothetical protein